MNDLYRNLDITKLSSSINTVTANLQDYDLVTPTLARVCISTSGKFPSRSDIRAAIAGLFKGSATPVEASFRNLYESGGIKVAVGFVKAASEIRSMDDAVQGKMKAMASNLLMDEADKSMWEIRSGSTGKYLVKQGNEDLSELAAMTVSRKASLPSLAAVASVAVVRTEFAAFIDRAVEEVRYGYIVASSDCMVEILPVDGEGETETVTPEDLVQVVNLDGEDVKETGLEMSASVMNDKSAMIEYYKKAFQHSPDYVQQIIDQINQHAFA